MSNTGKKPEELSSIQKMNKLQFEQDIEKLSSNLQKVDLALTQMIPHGFILLGNCKIGKTVFSHILLGNEVKWLTIDEELVLTATTPQKQIIKINNSMDSQIKVPKITPIKLNNHQQQFNLIDTSGYSLSNGVFYLYANFYYQYKLFQKVKNIKFILCFQASELQRNCKGFIEEIVMWNQLFKDNFNKNLNKKIWKSVAFVITMVEEKHNIKDLIKTLKNIVKEINKQYVTTALQKVKELIEFIIDENRLFYIKKIKKGEVVYFKENFLERINSKITDWWNQDMTEVKINLSELVLKVVKDDPINLQQYKDLVCYFNLRLFDFLRQGSLGKQNFSFLHILDSLVQDATNGLNTCEYLQVMKKYVKKFEYLFEEDYQEHRQIRQKQLFGLQEDPDFQSNIKHRFINKFKCIQKIQRLKFGINNIYLVDRDIKMFQLFGLFMQEMIKEFSSIVQNNQELTQVVYKFGYIAHRIIEQHKIYSLFFEIQQLNKSRLISLANGEFVEFHRTFIDRMGWPYRYGKIEVAYQDIHLIFIQNLDLEDEKFYSVPIQDLVQFFTYFEIINQKDRLKCIQVIIKYSQEVFQELQQTFTFRFDQLKGKLLRNLYSSRIKCENLYRNQTSKSLKDKITVALIKITRSLGRLLQLMGKFHLARVAYKSVQFVSSTIRVYTSELDFLSEQAMEDETIQKYLTNLTIQLEKYIFDHSRQINELHPLQDQYQLVDDVNELKIITDKILHLCSKKTQYINEISNEIYFKNFDCEMFEKDIEQISHRADYNIEGQSFKYIYETF